MNSYEFELNIIEISKIKRNPNNPRGENIRENDDQFQYLKRSIKEFGLMVPIVVQKLDSKGNEYLLLDGERRYLALRELGEKKVPAHVLINKIDAKEGKTLMFHIHTNRVQWDAYQQCKALEPLYEELKKKFKNNENNIAKELVLSTGTNKRTISSRLNFLRWPKKIKEIVYNKKPDLYYSIVEIESQIITPAQKNFKEYFEVVDIDDVRESLFIKYYDGIIHAAIESRKLSPIVKVNKEEGKKYKYALSIFKKIIKQPKYTFERAREDFVSEYPESDDSITISYNKFYNKLNRFYNSMSKTDIDILPNLNKTQVQKLNSVISELKNYLNEIEIIINENN